MANETFSEMVEAEEARRRAGDQDLLPPDAPADQVFLRKFFQAARRIRVEPVPADLRRSLEARFEEWRVGRAPASIARRVLAVLLSDVGPGMAVAGSRGVTAARHLLFSSDVADISVHVRDGREGAVLDGMVLRTDGRDEVCIVVLERDGVAVDQVTTDPLGSFRFEAVGEGDLVVVADLGHDDVATAAFDVQRGVA